MDERRKHKRYTMPRGTLVILRNETDRLQDHDKMNIGEIAMVIYKSSPEVIGQVTDMSIGGVAFEGKSIAISDAGNYELDLLMTEQGLYLHNLPFTPIESANGKGRRHIDEVRRSNAVRFNDLDERQRDQLNAVLAHRIE